MKIYIWGINLTKVRDHKRGVDGKDGQDNVAVSKNTKNDSNIWTKFRERLVWCEESWVFYRYQKQCLDTSFHHPFLKSPGGKRILLLWPVWKVLKCCTASDCSKRDLKTGSEGVIWKKRVVRDVMKSLWSHQPNELAWTSDNEIEHNK